MRVTHLNGLRALEATLRTGNFRSAARELGVTAAAVGQQVRTLESYLGCDLFYRSAAGVKAAPVARHIEQQLTACFSSLESVVETLRQSRFDQSISITMPSSFAESWFANRLAGFYRLNSNVDLRLNASNRMVDLHQEGYDFAIRYSEPGDGAFTEQVLFYDYVLPVCTPAFAENHHLDPGIKSLGGVPVIHLTDRTPDPEWADWPQWCDAFDMDPGDTKRGIHLSDFNSGVQVAIKGQGLVLCSIVESYDAIIRGELVAPFGLNRARPTRFSYRLIEVRTQTQSDVQDQFQTWLTGQAGDFRGQLEQLLGG